ncbi:unnamed protein product [Leptidea sinapis]|uniref:Uncharacterized protein n=1 Tax=Leptidea sinapis TaxID=189913 RepID=A0A5E4R6K7_9NEOP|nr:unnamed protein product [Leptidea sinapis]
MNLNVSNGARAVCREVVTARGGAMTSRGSGAGPRAVEPALAELALAHSRVQMYFNFLRRRVDSFTFPIVWTQANVVPIHKKGDKENVINYR